MAERPIMQDLIDKITSRSCQQLWWIPPDGWQLGAVFESAGVLPGSFNPLHRGHLSLCRVAAKRLGGAVAAELSMVNVDKPTLSAADVERRCLQFTAHPVVVTTTATFTEKSRLFPGATFIVGADTAARVVNPQFYQGDSGLLNAALKQIRRSGCSFLVAVRYGDARLLTLEDLKIPRAHRRLFTEIPADEFRVDLSSTDLRHGP
jgi:hypothetical protein